MPFEPFASVPLGRTPLAVTRLGFGGGSIGGLFSPVDVADAVAMVEHAWSIGIRYFDVAPLYGYGASERAMGEAARELTRGLSASEGSGVFGANAERVYGLA